MNEKRKPIIRPVPKKPVRPQVDPGVAFPKLQVLWQERQKLRQALYQNTQAINELLMGDITLNDGGSYDESFPG